MARTRLSKGLTAIGIFLFFGAAIASLAATTLLWRGTALDSIWALNPRAHSELAPFGRAAGIALFVLGACLVAGGVGWFKRRIWGWRLAVAIIATQILGDLVNAFIGRVIEGTVGVLVAGALLIYLLRPEVRTAFATEDVSNNP